MQKVGIDVTLTILFHEEILKNILESKDDEYAVSENINMAAGVAWWLICIKTKFGTKTEP